MKKKLFTAACALFICAVLSACGMISSPAPSKIGTVTKEQAPESADGTKKSTEAPKTTEAPLKEIYQVGDIVEVKNLKMIYTACGEYVSSNSFIQPADGNKYIYLEFYVENTGNSSSGVSSFDFEAYADGYAVDRKYFDGDMGGSLSPGRWNIGRVYFEVPANAAEIEAEYEYNIISGKKLKFAYEGEKNSGFVPEAKTARTENAFRPGDVIDTGKLKISYLGCDYFESGNMFIKPDEGNVFIYLEFEFENTSDSDRSVNSLLFHCFADGRVCSSTSVRDDDLSASLSPGRKAKGTVAFQVPKDAAVIEIEYQESLLSERTAVFSFEK